MIYVGRINQEQQQKSERKMNLSSVASVAFGILRVALYILFFQRAIRSGQVIFKEKSVYPFSPVT